MEPWSIMANLLSKPDSEKDKRGMEWEFSCVSVAGGAAVWGVLDCVISEWADENSHQFISTLFWMGFATKGSHRAQLLLMHFHLRYVDPSIWKQDTNQQTPNNTPETVLPQNVRCISHTDTNRYYRGGIACLSAGFATRDSCTDYCLQFPLSVCFSAIPMWLHSLSDWANGAN